MTFKKYSRKHSRTSGALITVAVIVLTMIVACSPTSHDEQQSASEVPEITPAPTTTWSEVLQLTPYPYTTPLPPAVSTILDGTYTKFDPRPSKRAPCRRCPPYPPEGGVWKLNLDRGVFRVYHDDTGWRTLGSFAASGDRVEFFNDPHCHEDTGIYTWKLDDGELVLGVVEDHCGTNLRARSFTELAWESCQPPSIEAAVSNHWPTPLGCGTIGITLEE